MPTECKSIDPPDQKACIKLSQAPPPHRLTNSMQTFISIFSSDTHESELRKRDEEIKKLKELLKRKQELTKRDKEIKLLKKQLESGSGSESESGSGSESESGSGSESEADSGSVYDPSESDSESVYDPSEDEGGREGRAQHCSHCNELGHKVTTCPVRWAKVIKNLRCPQDVLRDCV